MKKTYILTSIVVVISLFVLFVFIRLSSGKVIEEMNFATAKEGNLEIIVSGTGELVPERSTDTKGPRLVQYRNIRISGLKITDIIPEGTRVLKGDYIATLDRTVFDNNLKDEESMLKDIQTLMEMKILDTAVVLSALRDDIRNQVFEVEENGLTVEQSKYEPPATIRLAELDLDKSKRLLIQKNKLYMLKKLQTITEIKDLRTRLNIQQRKVDELNDILKQFVITAPSNGIVVFKTDRQGVKIKSGSTLNPFSPVVATLPDLSSMLSKLYVSEIDINKIKVGQPVQVTVDALKGKNLSGEVFSIANIGEDLINSDSKMFEVLVKVDDHDSRLMPSMTTGNKLITKAFNDVIYIPIESVHTGADSIPFVYTKSEIKQIVLLGESNDKHVIVEQGLEPGTSVWLRIPDNSGKFQFSGTGLVEIIKERENIRRKQLKTFRKDELIGESGTKAEPIKKDDIVFPMGSAN